MYCLLIKASIYCNNNILCLITNHNDTFNVGQLPCNIMMYTNFKAQCLYIRYTPLLHVSAIYPVAFIRALYFVDVYNFQIHFTRQPNITP